MSEQKHPIPVLEGLDERQRGVVDDARFFEPYRPELRELYGALDEPWSNDPRELVGPALKNWLIGNKNEHGNDAGKKQYTPGQTTDALQVLTAMHVLSPVRAPRDVPYEMAIVLGGVDGTNARRLAQTPDGIPTTILQVGQRLHEARDGTKAALTEALEKLALDGRGDPFVSQELARPQTASNPWAARQATETAMGRRTVLERYGNVPPYRIDLGTATSADRHVSFMQPKVRYVATDGTPMEVPPRLITDYRYQTVQGHDVIVMNAAARLRAVGARHDTKSTTEELLERFPPSQGANVLFVTSAPHLHTVLDMKTVLAANGHADINVHAALAGTPPEMPIQVALGALAALLAKDVERNYN